MLSDRTFGVEIEHNNPKYVDEYGELDGGTLGANLAAAGFATWDDIDYDGSGFEVVSPVLKGEDGLREFGAVLSWLEGEGGEVTQEDGLHVHHGAEEFMDAKEGEVRIALLIKSWAANQLCVNQLVAPWRGPDAKAIQGTHCYKQITPEIGDAMVAALNQGYGRLTPITQKCGGQDRFRSLNIQSLHKHGTIELRQHHGTFDFERAAAWILFGQKFIETCINSKEPIKQYTSASAFMRCLGVPLSDRKILKGAV